MYKEQIQDALKKIEQKEGLAFPLSPASKLLRGVWAVGVLRASLRGITGNEMIEVAYLAGTELHIRCEGEEEITIPNTNLISMIGRMLDA